MFHFLLISDETPGRREHIVAQAEVVMKDLRGDTPHRSVVNRSVDILTWGGTSPFRENEVWQLGIGSWIGPDHPPTAAALRSAPSTQISRYDGTYCFLAGSTEDTEVYGVVDPIGRMHVYYATPSTSTLLISNSALMLSALTQAAWVPASVREFLAKGTVFDQRSLHFGVNKLAPHQLYQFRPGHVQTHDIARSSPDLRTDTKSILAAFSDAVTENLADILGRYQRPLLDLTGGFDSRLVLACMLQLRSPKEISTVVVGTDNDPDVIVANAIARKLGLQHRQILPPVETDYSDRELRKALLLTDAEYDILQYVKVLCVHERLSQEFDASINGSGGELIRDEWWQVFTRPFALDRPWDAERLAARRFATDTWGETMLAPPPADSLTRHFATLIEAAIAPLGDDAPVTRRVDEVYLDLRMQRWQGRLASATHGIWPNYSPLLMQRPVEIALQAPRKLRRNGLMPRLLLAKLHRTLADMPMVDGAPASPVTWRNRHQHLPRYHARLRYFAKAAEKRWVRNRRKRSPPNSEESFVEELTQTLIPQEMLSMELYAAGALKSALHDPRKTKLSGVHFGRLFTLEQATRMQHHLQHLIER